MAATPNAQSTAPTFSLTTLRDALATMIAEHPERECRLNRAASIVALRTVERGLTAGWYVQSESDPSKWHWVFEGRCRCPDAQYRGNPCKHALAVELYERCERRDAELQDPSNDNLLVFQSLPNYTDADRFELTPQGYAYLASPEHWGA